LAELWTRAAPVPLKVRVSLPPLSPRRVKLDALELNVMELTMRLPFMSGDVRVLPVKMRSVELLNDGVVLGFQLFLVFQRSFAPPPSHVCAQSLPAPQKIRSTPERSARRTCMP
jgi:hypothetical protein